MALAPLKLRATHADDLLIISGLLQDAIASTGEMSYVPTEKIFMLALQRFCWEKQLDAAAVGCERINCVLTISGVERVQSRQLERGAADQPHDLLAVTASAHGLLLTFAADAQISLLAPRWQVQLVDRGEAWPALCTPCHDEPPIDVTIPPPA